MRVPFLKVRGSTAVSIRRAILVSVLGSAASLAAASASAQQVSGEIPRATIAAGRLDAEESSVVAAQKVDGDTLSARRASTSDSAQLLDGLPGLSFYSGGGVSSLPVIDGMADDRLHILVDGMSVGSSCPNHMNPPLSYIDPASVERISVIAGITPVSLGGDSIGGTIAFHSADPVFATSGAGLRAAGSAAMSYRSNGDALTSDVHGSVASEHLFAGYTYSSTQANDYRDGAGSVVHSTEYKSTNNLLTLATHFGDHLVSLTAGWQSIPYQAFPNEYMDMTRNSSMSLNARYKGAFTWGELEARAYRQRVTHSMDALTDKADLGMATTGMPYAMPVNTRGVDSGELLQANIRLPPGGILRIGQEYHRYTLDDWWPAIPDSMMNGPDTFWDIHDGRRERLALFGEWEQTITSALSSQIGARLERVTMNTGSVQGYFSSGESMMDPPMPDGSIFQDDANAFNARDHQRTDNNVDITAALHFEPATTASYDVGVARKTRSPTLYERYAWSHAAGMAGTMISWFGDLNAYVGNLDLKPEVAYQVRAEADWHDAARARWSVTAALFYSRVDDYINVQVDEATTMMPPPGRVALQFVNHDARLYGVDASARTRLGSVGGEWSLAASLSIVRAKDLDSGTNLYNIMPTNGRLSLEHRLGHWASSVEWQLVDAKTRTDTVREELQTPGYSLLNLRTAYTWRAVTIHGGIDNALDRRFGLPLGGVDFYTYNNLASVPPDRLAPVAGAGRSVNVGLTVQF